MRLGFIAFLCAASVGCSDTAPGSSDVGVDAAWFDAAGSDVPGLPETTADGVNDTSTDEGTDEGTGADGRPLEDTAAETVEQDVDTTDGADASGDVPAPPSRCDATPLAITCDHLTTTLYTGVTGFTPREVHHQVPLGEAPEGGWPVAILFQGSLFTAQLFWVIVDAPLGALHQVALTKTLLDAGFAVVTPEALGNGATAWQTNVPPASLAWSFTEDHALMLDLFDAIEDGDFGPLDAGRMYAAGISSGGYMTSRMDKEYRERFKALAIHSGSYATCAGPVCTVPSDLDAGHLPTLFLHGGLDLVVPQWTMELYRDALDGLGVSTDTVVQEDAAHEWLQAAPEAIRDWFSSH